MWSNLPGFGIDVPGPGRESLAGLSTATSFLFFVIDRFELPSHFISFSGKLATAKIPC